MRRLTLVALSLFLGASAALAQDAVGCAAKVHAGRAFTVCAFDPKTHGFRLFLDGPDTRPLLTFGRLLAALPKGEAPAMAMNAGMYHRDFSPVGAHADAVADVARRSRL